LFRMAAELAWQIPRSGSSDIMDPDANSFSNGPTPEVAK
jgi:hypothetical protein